MSDPGLLTAFSRGIFGALVEAGLGQVILSPGSRSTPFVAAAAAQPGLAIHDVADERAAAFYALGQARISGRASVLVCTSGTAGAHYLPAIIEAGHAHLPLLVLTADRPLELVGTGANQTIDQSHLYGRHVRGFFELVPEDTELGFLALRRIVQQALFLTTHPTPGAVHLNARASKPLEPREPGPELAARVGRVFARAPTKLLAPSATIASEDLAEIASLVGRSKRGLVVLGPQPLSAASGRTVIAALAAKTGFAVYAEATSQQRVAGLDSADLFEPIHSVESNRARLEPDLILELGAPPTSTAYLRLIESTKASRIVVHPHAPTDAAQNATQILLADPIDFARGLAERLGVANSTSYREELTTARRAALHAIRATIEATPGLTEAEVVSTLVARLPASALLAIGNSLAVRHVDGWAPSPPTPLTVLHQRGVSGIDGLVAGAAGAASQVDRPVVLLIGDVSLGHDLSSLALLDAQRAPIVVVTIQNRGGRIFEQLPIVRTKEWPALSAHFLTPPKIDFDAAARAFGVGYAKAETGAAFERALDLALGTRVVTLIEAIVPPEGAAVFQAQVRARIEASS